MWCIGQLNGEYLANMEDILDLYAQPKEEGITRLCFDERPCQLLDHVLRYRRSQTAPEKSIKNTKEKGFVTSY